MFLATKPIELHFPGIVPTSPPQETDLQQADTGADGAEVERYSSEVDTKGYPKGVKLTKRVLYDCKQIQLRHINRNYVSLLFRAPK